MSDSWEGMCLQPICPSKGSDIQRKVVSTRIAPTPTLQTAHHKWRPTLDISFGFDMHKGEYESSALGEYSVLREGARVETANYGRFSSFMEEDGLQATKAIKLTSCDSTTDTICVDDES